MRSMAEFKVPLACLPVGRGDSGVGNIEAMNRLANNMRLF